MVLNIISTVNGMENEGMRNIASHMIRELKSMCNVRCSALRNPIECLKNTVGADAVIIFARASSKTAILAKVLRLICKKVYFILVQKPESAFIDKIEKNADKYGYFAILPKDGEALGSRGIKVRKLSVGINKAKFHPAENRNEVASLRRKYGIPDEKILVLHVGHLSDGRGLEELLNLPKDRFERLVVASGMFNSVEIEEKLRADGVNVIKEYLPNVSEVYRMADVYLFPTRSTEFVISVPLSVIEALACGIPVVAYQGVDGINMIDAVDGAVTTVTDKVELERAVMLSAEKFSDNFESLLTNMGSWTDAAKAFLDCISEDVK